MDKEQILFLGLNNKKTLLLIGTELGFRVVNFHTLELLVNKQLSGGIGPIDCLETSNILAMTGGGLFPYYPPNKVVIWDDYSSKIKAEIVFKQEVNTIRFKYEYLFVLTDMKIFVYSFFENLSLKKEIDTIYNPKGVFETNAIDVPCYFAHLNHSAVRQGQAGEIIGTVWIHNLSNWKRWSLEAHSSPVYCMKFNVKGNYFATASEKGTVIKLFITETGQMIKEMRRGLESTLIYSIDFDYLDSWLVCISKTGTIHAWSLG